MKTVEVDKNDLKRLCDTVLSNWCKEVESGRNAYLECDHCDGAVYWDDDSNKIKHDLNCIYLVARGIRDSLGD